MSSRVPWQAPGLILSDWPIDLVGRRIGAGRRLARGVGFVAMRRSELVDRFWQMRGDMCRTGAPGSARALLVASGIVLSC